MVRWLTASAVLCSLTLVGCGSSTSTSATATTGAESAATTGSTLSSTAASGPGVASTPPTTKAGSSAPSGPVVACDIVKRADVEAAFGGSSSDGVPGKAPEYCDFTLSGTLKSGKVVDAMGATVGVWWNEYPLDPNSKVYNAAATTVPELGVAFYQPSGRALVVSYHGGTLNFQAEGTSNDDTAVQPMLVALAKATMTR
jgi:hypothetical protein